jgi:hypothetical protein
MAVHLLPLLLAKIAGKLAFKKAVVHHAAHHAAHHALGKKIVEEGGTQAAKKAAGHATKPVDQDSGEKG